MQTHPTNTASLSETDPSLPSTISCSISDRQGEPLSEAFLGSILADRSGILASVPVSPIASHHPPGSLNVIRSATNNYTGPSRLDGRDPISP